MCRSSSPNMDVCVNYCTWTCPINVGCTWSDKMLYYFPKNVSNDQGSHFLFHVIHTSNLGYMGRI